MVAFELYNRQATVLAITAGSNGRETPAYTDNGWGFTTFVDKGHFTIHYLARSVLSLCDIFVFAFSLLSQVDLPCRHFIPRTRQVLSHSH